MSMSGPPPLRKKKSMFGWSETNPTQFMMEAVPPKNLPNTP